MQIHSFEPQLTLNFPHQKLYYIKGNVYSMAVTDRVKNIQPILTFQERIGS